MDTAEFNVRLPDGQNVQVGLVPNDRTMQYVYKQLETKYHLKKNFYLLTTSSIEVDLNEEVSNFINTYKIRELVVTYEAPFKFHYVNVYIKVPNLSPKLIGPILDSFQELKKKVFQFKGSIHFYKPDFTQIKPEEEETLTLSQFHTSPDFPLYLTGNRKITFNFPIRDSKDSIQTEFNVPLSITKQELLLVVSAQYPYVLCKADSIIKSNDPIFFIPDKDIQKEFDELIKSAYDVAYPFLDED